MSEGPLRVLIVDDHPVVRDGVRSLLDAEPHITVVAEAADGLQALELVARERPDVVLMDLRMPRLDGVAATLRITSEHPDVRVLVLTTYDRDSDIARAIEAGATGYLLKDAPRDDLLRAVRASARGEPALAPGVARKLMRGRDGVELTAREREVLRLVARGATNREIGRELHVAEATVKTHLLNVYARLGVDDRTAAVVRALELGQIDLGTDRG